MPVKLAWCRLIFKPMPYMIVSSFAGVLGFHPITCVSGIPLHGTADPFGVYLSLICFDVNPRWSVSSLVMVAAPVAGRRVNIGRCLCACSLCLVQQGSDSFSGVCEFLPLSWFNTI